MVMTQVGFVMVHHPPPRAIHYSGHYNAYSASVKDYQYLYVCMLNKNEELYTVNCVTMDNRYQSLAS